MADLTITASTVSVTSAGAGISSGVAAGTITPGQPLYKDPANSSKLTTCSTTASANSPTCVGISIGYATIGQYVSYVASGTYAVGATVVVGGLYCVSINAGKIAPFADLTTGDVVSVIGVGATASTMTLILSNTGVTHA